MQPLLVELVKSGDIPRAELAAQLRTLTQVHKFLAKPPEEKENDDA